MFAPSPTTTMATSSPTTSGIPKDLPRIIQAPQSVGVQQPSNTTMIQIGFLYGLNYPFVSNNVNSTNQIFAYLPSAIADGLSIAMENVTMHALQPYDTTADLGYITTLAMAYIPTDMVNTLALDLRNPVATLYNNPSNSVKGLTDLINPSIPLIAGSVMAADGTTSTSGVPGSNKGDDNGDGSTLGGNNGQQQATGVKGSSVGIGVGVVAGAAVYGAAMFWVARRYKRRRQGHSRTSSLTGGDASTAHSSINYGSIIGGGALSGPNSPTSHAPYEDHVRESHGSAGGRSQRNAPISAPLMTENSLGWN